MLRISRLFHYLLISILLISASWADSLRIATWNVSDYANNDARRSNFQTSIYGINPANGLSFSPDVFVGQEFRDTSAITHFLGTLNSAANSPGDWAAAPFLDISPVDSLNNAFFYRTNKVQYLGQQIISASAGIDPLQPRHTLRHDIQIRGTNDSIGIYNTHMKASVGTSENTRRQAEADFIRNNAQGINTNGAGSGLPAGFHYLLAGDFNMKASTEQPFQTLTQTTYESSSAGRFVDPVAATGEWDNSSTSNRRIMTNDGATGLDDRFDMILLSPSLVDANGTAYVNLAGNLQTPTTFSTTTWNDPNHSYRVWGNDGSQGFDGPLNTTSNQMVGNTIAQAIINTGAQHLPVYLDIGFTAVPEPGSMVLVSIVIASTCIYRRRLFQESAS
jgi:hypothetical protein